MLLWTVLTRNGKQQCLDNWDCRQTSAGCLLNTAWLACYDSCFRGLWPCGRQYFYKCCR